MGFSLDSPDLRRLSTESEHVCVEGRGLVEGEAGDTSGGCEEPEKALGWPPGVRG